VLFPWSKVSGGCIWCIHSLTWAAIGGGPWGHLLLGQGHGGGGVEALSAGLLGGWVRHQRSVKGVRILHTHLHGRTIRGAQHSAVRHLADSGSWGSRTLSMCSLLVQYFFMMMLLVNFPFFLLCLLSEFSIFRPVGVYFVCVFYVIFPVTGVAALLEILLLSGQRLGATVGSDRRDIYSRSAALNLV